MFYDDESKGQRFKESMRQEEKKYCKKRMITEVVEIEGKEEGG